MQNKFEKLNILVGKKVLELQAEISSIIPLNDRNRDVQIETPLQISLQEYSLLIYNSWKLEGIVKSIKELKGNILLNISFENGILKLWFSNEINININLNDNGYLGPESMVLYGPEKSIIVWD